jgi:probable F420-dependent oxidoreductase
MSEPRWPGVSPVPPRLLVALPAGTNDGADDVRALVDLAVRAEGAGIDGVVLSDHVVIGPRTDRYPWGRFPFPPDAPWLEPLTVLTAIATVTSTLRLTTGVLVAPLRPAALLAKTVATIDQLSGGRIDLGVGTGWQAEEFEAQGLDAADRGRLLTDTIAACRALWGEQPAQFESATVAFRDVFSVPVPVRVGGPPVLFSGTLTARNIDRIVRLGDGWIPIMKATVDDVAQGIQALRLAFVDADRDPRTLMVRFPLPLVRRADAIDVEATLAQAYDLVALGVTELSIPLVALARDLVGMREALPRLGTTWVHRAFAS